MMLDNLAVKGKKTLQIKLGLLTSYEMCNVTDLLDFNGNLN